MGGIRQTQGFSSNVGIGVEGGFIAVGDVYVPKLKHLSYVNDVPFKVLEIYNGDCVMLFLDGRDTTISPKYLLQHYRKATPVELEFYDLSK